MARLKSRAPKTIIPAAPFVAAQVERLYEPLLGLHAALEVEPLWRSFLKVVRAALPVHRVTLFLGHLGMGEARVVLTDPPIADPERWYAARGEGNPFSPWIEAHRGVELYRFSEVLPARDAFVRTEFYRRFAEPEGWDKGLSVLYWENGDMTAMFSLYRAPGEPEFTEAELAVLRYLHPLVGIAIERVRRLHTERMARRGLEEFNKSIPVGLVVLAWELAVEFANAEAQANCAVWNFGAKEARALNARDVFAMPEPVLAACRRLRAAVAARNPKQLRSLPEDAETVVQGTGPVLRARVTALNSSGSALARPRFLVVLDTREGVGTREGAGAGAAASDEGGDDAGGGPESGRQGAGAVGGMGRGARLSRLRELTPREREIVALVCEGQTNAEIARRLSKSVLTIKTQLNSVFRKMGVSSRAKLMVALR